MVERFLLALLARARGSKGGTTLIIVGVLFLLVFLVFSLVSVAGNAVFMMTGAGPAMEFLGTGPGILTGFVVAVVLILLGVAFLTHATPQPQSGAVIQQTGTAQAESNREVVQLRKRLHRAEQERDRLRAMLSDPTAKKRRAEEMLRRRCIEVAYELHNFVHARKYTDSNETVARFNQRHEWKVNELRNRLNEQELLTPQEHDTLTLHADDYSHKIEEMMETLKTIGLGH